MRRPFGESPPPERAARRALAVRLTLGVAGAGAVVATAVATVALTTGGAVALAARGHTAKMLTGHTVLTKVPPATVADPARGVSIRLNHKPDLARALPVLTPHTAGSCQVSCRFGGFVPASTLAPCANFKLAIPSGLAAVGAHRLGTSRTVSFTTACPSTTALQEALARLGYLPYVLKSIYGIDLAGPLTRPSAAARAYDLPHASLLPRERDVPPLHTGTVDPTTTGALEVYEDDHGLPLGTTPTEALWQKLLADEVLARGNPRPYTWVTVTETIPETLEVHEGRRIALTTPANTGVPGAATQQGVFPIYVRYTSTTMTGTNVDGSHYVDPGIPWVNYFNGGDAIHGYIRPSYGVPQSNGCVELPIATAGAVYPLLAVGDIVVVK